jgi:short-chain Z-isoprenyl diphosphate synthase
VGGVSVRSIGSLAYDLYERRLLRRLSPDQIPSHIGVMCDGNRRWAKEFGEGVEGGYIAGADKIEEFLSWCDQLQVKLVTLWLLSTDNLNRPAREVVPLMRVIEGLVDELASTRRWQINPVGALDMLPSATAERLKAAAEATSDVNGMAVNIAVAYGGRRELADAVRSLLHEHAAQGTTIEELAEFIDVDHIAEHLYTAGHPASSACRDSCSGRAPTASSTSARRCGRTSGELTFCERSVTMRHAIAGSVPNRLIPLGVSAPGGQSRAVASAVTPGGEARRCGRPSLYHHQGQPARPEASRSRPD